MQARVAAVNHHDTGPPHVHISSAASTETAARSGSIAATSRTVCADARRTRHRGAGPPPQLDVRRIYAKEMQDDYRARSRDRARARNHVELCSAAQPGPIDGHLVAASSTSKCSTRRAPSRPRRGNSASAGRSPWDLGSRGDILKQIHAAISGDPAHTTSFAGDRPWRRQAGGSQVLSGRVASKGLSELKGTFYAVFETPTGRRTTCARPGGRRDDPSGRHRVFTTKPEAPVRPIDDKIATTPRPPRVYTLQPRPTAPRTRTTTSARTRALGLATPEAPHRWKVSPHLLTGARERAARTTPRPPVCCFTRSRFRCKPGPPSGPVWLDRVRPLLAPTLRGRTAPRRQRAASSRPLGVQPDDPPARQSCASSNAGCRKTIAARIRPGLPSQPPEGFRGASSSPTLAPPELLRGVSDANASSCSRHRRSQAPRTAGRSLLRPTQRSTSRPARSRQGTSAAEASLRVRAHTSRSPAPAPPCPGLLPARSPSFAVCAGPGRGTDGPSLGFGPPRAIPCNGQPNPGIMPTRHNSGSSWPSTPWCQNR